MNLEKKWRIKSMTKEKSTAMRQSRALLGIGESVKHYANLYNHYIRVDMWDKACHIMHMIDNLGCALPFIDESLMLDRKSVV